MKWRSGQSITSCLGADVTSSHLIWKSSKRPVNFYVIPVWFTERILFANQLTVYWMAVALFGSEMIMHFGLAASELNHLVS